MDYLWKKEPGRDEYIDLFESVEDPRIDQFTDKHKNEYFGFWRLDHHAPELYLELYYLSKLPWFIVL